MAGTKSRNWMGTCNNPEIPAEEFLRYISEQPNVDYVTGQLEAGEAETEHVQYYVNLSAPRAMSFMKGLCNRSHWEIARSTEASRKYVMKEDTRIEGPFEFGKRPVEKRNKHDIEQ